MVGGWRLVSASLQPPHLSLYVCVCVCVSNEIANIMSAKIVPWKEKVEKEKKQREEKEKKVKEKLL